MMELLDVCDRLYKLKQEERNLDNFIAKLDMDKSTRPLSGHYWFKMKRAMEEVHGEMLTEIEEIEDKIEALDVDIKLGKYIVVVDGEYIEYYSFTSKKFTTTKEKIRATKFLKKDAEDLAHFLGCEIEPEPYNVK